MRRPHSIMQNGWRFVVDMKGSICLKRKQIEFGTELDENKKQFKFMICENEFIVREIPQQYKIVKVGNGGLTLTGTQFEELQETVGEPNARRILRKYENGNNSDDLYIVYIKKDDKVEIVDEIYGFETLINKYKGIVRFTKAERSSFRY